MRIPKGKKELASVGLAKVSGYFPQVNDMSEPNTKFPAEKDTAGHSRHQKKGRI